MKVQFYDVKEKLPNNSGNYWAVTVNDRDVTTQMTLHYSAKQRMWNVYDGGDTSARLDDVRFWAELPTYEELRNDW